VHLIKKYDPAPTCTYTEVVPCTLTHTHTLTRTNRSLPAGDAS